MTVTPGYNVVLLLPGAMRISYYFYNVNKSLAVAKALNKARREYGEDYVDWNKVAYGTFKTNKIIY